MIFFSLLQAGASGGANFIFLGFVGFFFFSFPAIFLPLRADTAPNMCFKREKCEVFRWRRKGPERRRRLWNVRVATKIPARGFYGFPIKKKKNADQVLSNAIK